MNSMKGTNGIIGDNLSLLETDSYGVSERRLVWLYERAKLVLRDDSLIFGENRAEDFPALFETVTIPEGIPTEASPRRMARTIAAEVRYASLPPRRTQALPLFKARPAASLVTLGRDS